MSTSGALRYALWSSGLALIVGGVLLFFTVSRGETAIRWCLLGWLIMAAIGIPGGSAMAAFHGRPGSAFIGALVGSMLARLVASALGAWAASPIGYRAAWPYVVGLGVGYVPLQVFEALWFLNRGSSRSPHSQTEGPE